MNDMLFKLLSALKSMVDVISLLLELYCFGILFVITLGLVVSSSWPCKVDLVPILCSRTFFLVVVYWKVIFVVIFE